MTARVVFVVVACAALGACGPGPEPEPPDEDNDNDLAGVDSEGAFFDDNALAALRTGFFHRRFIANVENVELFALSVDQACSRMTANQNDIADAYANNAPGEGQISALAKADNDWFPVDTTTLRLTFPDPQEATGTVALPAGGELEVCTKVEAAELRFDAFGGPFLYTNVVCWSATTGSATLEDLTESHLVVSVTSTMQDGALAAAGDATVSADVLRCTPYEDAVD
jgi:hypothetical protein